MGVYDAECGKCGKQEEYVRPFSQCLDTPECCGTKMNKVILTAPQVGAMCWTDHKGFYAGGRYIANAGDMKRYMNEKGLVTESEGAQEVARVRARREKEDREDLVRTVQEVADAAGL